MNTKAIPLPGEDGKRRFESWCGDEIAGREIARYGYATINSAMNSARHIAVEEGITVRVTQIGRKRDPLSVVALADGRVYLAERHGSPVGALPLSDFVEDAS